MEFLRDKINLKDLPEEISSYFKQNSIKGYNNLRIFYTRLLEEISEDVKNSYLNRILKYLSCDSSSVINIIEDFNEDVYDKELQLFCNKLVAKSKESCNYKDLYESLNHNIIYVFFDKDEYFKLKEAHNNEEYELFLFILLKHCFKKYQDNLPGIVCKKFYEEALTLAYNSKHRMLMMKASADLGNADAAILYADCIYYEDIDEAMYYFVKAKSKVAALWEIGFALENNCLKNETRAFIQKELSECFLEDDVTKDLIVTDKGKERLDEKSLLMGVKMYSYIEKKYRFTKAINSIGKLLIFDYISYKNSREESIKLAKKYLQRGIQLGNLNAMTNLSVYYTNNPEDNEYDYELIKRLFKFCADLGDAEACNYYGKILMSEGDEKSGFNYLLYAGERNDKFACFELGKYYELKENFTEAINWYKKAISNRYYDAAYNLSLVYFQLNSIHNEKDIEYVELAKRYLDEYKDKLTDVVKAKAEKLLAKLK